MERHDLPATNAMFQGERGANISIHNGTFIQHNQPPPAALTVHNCYDKKDGFSHLQAHVATSAFDSADQVDAPKCHPSTRQAVQDEIMDWILQNVTCIQWILWMNGAAGAGKSAIARSIVALCLERNIPIARFFFFRTDSTRNTVKSIVPTLVYQLIHQLPDLLAIVVPKIESDPLIFTKSLETQLRYLIFEPLRRLHRKSPLGVVVLLLDGVDECNGHRNQTDLVHLIANFLSTRDLPVIVFFGSRAESHLQQVFQSHDVFTSLHLLSLDNRYNADTDILLFLDDKFKQIRDTHPFKHNLSEDWPDPAHIQQLVGKSSGQFIYASVVINFVSSSRRNPAQQLEIIRGLRPVGNSTPFSQLDALYKHIFSQVDDLDRTSLILAWTIFGHGTPAAGFNANDIPVLLVDLASVLTYERNFIRFLHASLPDFLLDQTRSQEYYLDKKVWCARVSIYILRKVSAKDTLNSNLLYNLHRDYLPHAEGTTDLRENVLACTLNRISHVNYYWDIIPYLKVIQALDFGDDGELYQILLNRVVRQTLEPPHIHGRGDKLLSELRRTWDISTILAQIQSEGASGRDKKVESMLRSNLRLRPRNFLPKSANQPTAEAGTSRKARGRAKKRRLSVLP